MTTKNDLEARIAQLEAERDALLSGLNGLMSYVTSSKFTGGNSYVEAGDIVLRIREILSARADVEVEPYGLCNQLARRYGQLVPTGTVRYAEGRDGGWGLYRRVRPAEMED